MANVGERDFTVPFPFIDPSHVTVTVNGGGADILEWVNSSTVRLATPLQAGDLVLIARNTPIDDMLVKFLDGAVLTAEDLNVAVEQLLYKQQELTDLYNGSINEARQRILLANGIGVDPADIANQVAAIAAESSLLDDFRQRISDIESQGFTLGALSINLNELSAQTIARDNSLSAITTQVTSLAGDLSGLRAVVDGLGQLQDGSGIATLIQNEQDSRIAGDTALAGTMALIGAKSGDNLSFILDLNTLKVSPTESLASRLSALAASDGANSAAITAEQTARANADSAEVTARTNLAATLRSETAALIASEQEARAAADSAEATARQTLAASVASNTAAIVSEQNTRAAADSAEATARLALAATVASNTAAITNEQKARADADTAEASARQALASTVGTNTAAIATEASTRASADAVFTGLFTLLGAKNAQGTAFVLDDSKVQLSNGTSLASRLTGIDTSLGSNSSAVASEITARTNADNALSSRIDTMNTTVNGYSASITTLQTTTNGIAAKYGVALDVNGYVTGFVQNNNGSSGTFAILADKFAVVTPGANPVVPFEVSGGNVYVNGQRITPGSIGADRINVSSLSALTATIGLLRTATSGARLELESNQIRVYDASNVMRVRIGIW